MPYAVCWMLTADDGGADGRYTEYVNVPDRWRHFDPNLFDALKNAIQRGIRDVRLAESDDVLPGAVFHWDLIGERRSEREQYFALLHREMAGTDLVFLDPDNGLEIRSRPYGRKDSGKHVFWSEIRRIFSAGHSILLYQHFPHENRLAFISRVASSLGEQLGASEIHSFATQRVAFFLVPQARHKPAFEEGAARVRKTWVGQVIHRLHCIPPIAPSYITP